MLLQSEEIACHNVLVRVTPKLVAGAFLLLVMLLVVVWLALAGYMNPTTGPGRKNLVNMFILSAAALVGTLTAIAAFGNLIVARQNLQQQRDLDEQRAQAEALQKYFELMGELFTENHLKKSKPDDDVALLARAQTLTVLKRLNLEVKHEELPKGVMLGKDMNLPSRPESIKAAALSRGKREVISFLKETGLINRDTPIVNLADADFTRTQLIYGKLGHSNLSGTNLAFSFLGSANLNDANLSGAQLWGAFLINTELIDADLSDTELIDANLTGAKLNNAKLSRAKFKSYLPGVANAILDGADLTGADLSEADISDEQLDTCKSITGATMPDGTKHP